MNKIDEIRGRLVDATKGDWSVDPDNAGSIWVEDPDFDCMTRVVQVYRTSTLDGQDASDDQFEADMAFVLNARKDIETLLAELDATKALLKELSEAAEASIEVCGCGDVACGWHAIDDRLRDALDATASQLED